jgi:hypothetical protein
MEVVHGVSLHGRGVVPSEAELAEAALHFADGEANLFAQSVRAEIAVAYNPLGIAAAAATKDGAAAFAGRVKQNA